MSEIKTISIEKTNSRLDYIDVAKAIGVYLSILGHLVIFNWKTFRFIFSFHMPLFFVIAGFVWGNRKELPDFKHFFTKQVKHYIIPFLIVFLLSIIQCILFPEFGYNKSRLFSDLTIIDLYEGHIRFSFFGASWFLLCMFWSQILVYCLMLIKKHNHLFYYLSLVLIAVLAVFSKDVFLIIPKFQRLPLKIDSALMATVFIIVGYYFSKLYNKFILQKDNKFKALIVVFLFVLDLAIVYFVSFKGNTYVNLCDIEYALPERYLIGSIAGSLMVINISFLLKKAKFLCFIGKNTLIIFLSHEFVYLNLIYLFNKVFNLSLAGQGMKLDFLCLLISFLTLGVCLIFVFIYSMVSKMILKYCKSNLKSKNA